MDMTVRMRHILYFNLLHGRKSDINKLNMRVASGAYPRSSLKLIW